jgi:hypothetical protein
VPKGNEDEESWPPIHVRGGTLSLDEMAALRNQKYGTFAYGIVVSEQRTTVEWFPGVNMYKALGVAARSGMEDVVRLLIAAGNDYKFLDINASLSKLMSTMRLSE